MPMHPNDLRAELARRRQSAAMVARRCGVSTATVCNVIEGKAANSAAVQELARTIGSTVEETFGPDFVFSRRGRPAKGENTSSETPNPNEKAPAATGAQIAS